MLNEYFFDDPVRSHGAHARQHDIQTRNKRLQKIAEFQSQCSTCLS